MRWVLLRAFGPPDALVSEVLNGDAASDLAGRFHLRERIAARTARGRLEREIGESAAESLALAHRQSSVQAMRLSALLATAVEIGARREIPIVLLKYAALEAQGMLLPGSRPAADVDLLVPAQRAEEFQAALASTGLVAGTFQACGHHLVPLRSHAGGSIELHHRLPGVRRGGRRSVEAGDLLSWGRVVRIDRLAGGCYAPDPELHAAYLMVHGFVQHGPFPRTYSLLTVLGDLIDLEASLPPGEAPDAGAVHPWISREMSKREVAAIFDLSRALREGVPEEGGRLLARILARTLSPEYQRRLVLRTLVPLSDAPKAVAIAGMVAKKLVPTTAHLDRVYGPRASRFGRFGRRIGRPFDLLYRALRALKPVEIGKEFGDNEASSKQERGAP